MSVKYTFAGITYSINEFEPITLPEFDPFKGIYNDSNTDAIVEILVRLCDQIPNNEGQEVFRDISGARVQIEDGLEVRYFDDYFTRTTFAKLIETKEMLAEHRKELLLYKPFVENIGIDDRRLLNTIAFEKDLARQHKVILHSSFIETDCGAILFTAPCQTGKSTQAELWRKYKAAKVHNGDRTCIWKEEDVWYAGGIPWCGTSGIMHNVKVTLKAIVVLSQGPENVIRRLKVRELIPNVIKQTTINSWDPEMLSIARNLWLDLAGDLPVYHLSCLPDQGAVDVLAKELGV